MMSVDPMDQFYDNYDRFMKKWENVAETVDPLNIDDQMEFAKVSIELKMMGGAVASTVGGRHSLLKKMINEIK